MQHIFRLCYHQWLHTDEFQPTRNNNILDIFLTNHPSLVSDINVLPGISNHEAVCVSSAITIKKTPPIKRDVYLWNRADFESINRVITEFVVSFTENTNDMPVQKLWDSFKTLCASCLVHVPTKQLSSNMNNQPWATLFIRCLSRNDDCINTGLQDDWTAYRAAKN